MEEERNRGVKTTFEMYIKPDENERCPLIKGC